MSVTKGVDCIGKAVGGMARETYVRLRPLEQVTRFTHIASTHFRLLLLVREFYQIFGKSGNKFPTKKFLHQYVC